MTTPRERSRRIPLGETNVVFLHLTTFEFPFALGAFLAGAACGVAATWMIARTRR